MNESTNSKQMATINRVREKQKHSSMEQFNHEDRVYTVIGKRTKGICGKATFFIDIVLTAVQTV